MQWPDAILAEALQRLRKVPGVDEAVILSISVSPTTIDSRPEVTRNR